MYAVIETGGKQYRVGLGERLKVETLAVEPGKTVELERVLMVSDGKAVKIGEPLVSGTKVVATVLGHGRGPKIRVFKMRRRKDSRSMNGHRQGFTELEIVSIGGAKVEAKPAKAAAAPAKKAAGKKKAKKKAAKKAGKTGAKKASKKTGKKKSS